MDEAAGVAATPLLSSGLLTMLQPRDSPALSSSIDFFFFSTATKVAQDAQPYFKPHFQLRPNFFCNWFPKVADNCNPSAVKKEIITAQVDLCRALNKTCSKKIYLYKYSLKFRNVRTIWRTIFSKRGVKLYSRSYCL